MILQDMPKNDALSSSESVTLLISLSNIIKSASYISKCDNFLVFYAHFTNLDWK